jgi:hypothetical protein
VRHERTPLEYWLAVHALLREHSDWLTVADLARASGVLESEIHAWLAADRADLTLREGLMLNTGILRLLQARFDRGR